MSRRFAAVNEKEFKMGSTGISLDSTVGATESFQDRLRAERRKANDMLFDPVFGRLTESGPR